MKYRIKKLVIGHDLKAIYIPEYTRLGLLWSEFEVDPIMNSSGVSFSTEEEAREYIKKQIAKKYTSTSYIAF